MKLPAELLLRFCPLKALRFFSSGPRMLVYRDFLSAGSSIDWAAGCVAEALAFAPFRETPRCQY